MNTNKQVCVLGVALTLMLLAGCSKNEAEVGETSLDSSASGTNQAVQAQPAKKSQAGVNVPISSYMLLSPDEDQIILTKLLVAKSGSLFSEDEALGLLSAQYYNEHDAFKKKDIAKALLPGLNKELQAMAGTSYLAIPIETVPYDQKGRSAFSINPLSVQTYNFDLSGFPLAGSYSAKDCWRSSFQNRQSVRVAVSGPDVPCFLSVKDEAQARAIENAVQSRDLKMQGMAYMQITASERSLHGQIMHAHIELTHQVTKEKLGAFDL